MSSRFRYYQPCELLRPYVRHYWSLRRDNRNVMLSDRTFPTGCVQMVFHRCKPLFVSDEGRLQPRAALTGQYDFWDILSSDGEMDMLVCVFQPYAARLFFHLPMSLLHNAEVSLDDIGDEEARLLGRMVPEAAGDSEAVRLIEQFLLNRLADADTLNARRTEAGIRLIEQSPAVGTERLADAACLSRKQLERVFTEQAGIAPGRFRRIVRFHRALYCLAMQPQPCMDWVQTAYTAGYADQSHMIREFRQFTGYTPAQYLLHYSPYSDYFQSPMECKCLKSSI